LTLFLKRTESDKSKEVDLLMSKLEEILKHEIHCKNSWQKKCPFYKPVFLSHKLANHLFLQKSCLQSQES